MVLQSVLIQGLYLLFTVCVFRITPALHTRCMFTDLPVLIAHFLTSFFGFSFSRRFLLSSSSVSSCLLANLLMTSSRELRARSRLERSFWDNSESTRAGSEPTFIIKCSEFKKKKKKSSRFYFDSEMSQEWVLQRKTRTLTSKQQQDGKLYV